MSCIFLTKVLSYLQFLKISQLKIYMIIIYWWKSYPISRAILKTNIWETVMEKLIINLDHDMISVYMIAVRWQGQNLSLTNQHMFIVCSQTICCLATRMRWCMTSCKLGYDWDTLENPHLLCCRIDTRASNFRRIFWYLINLSLFY